jgi:X-Pro dipeptidyl-peptidase
MPDARAAVLLVALALTAGCVAGPTSSSHPTASKHPIRMTAPEWDPIRWNQTLSQPRFTGLIKQDVWHSSWDETQLHTRLYRAADLGDWKAPIVLHMSPYFGANSAATGPVPSTGLDGWLIKYFVPRGYAVALNDVRGTGESGGCLEQTGPKQTKDGFKVVEELAGMAWSNGRVGMIGISYDGETQQSTATAQPPHLVTIIPMSSVAGQYDYNYYDAVPYTSVGIAGMTSYAGIGMQPPNPPVNNGAKPTNYGERAGCHPENLKEGSDPKGDFNQYWKDREIRLHVKQIVNTSVLYVHGLEDWNVKPVHIRGWYNELPAQKHAWLGQWQHNYPDGNTFNKDWSRSDWKLTVHRWYDHWLLGIDSGIMQEPPVQVQDSMGRWRFEDAWPPVPQRVSTYQLTTDGKLTTDPAAAGEVSYDDRGLPINDPRGDSRSFVTAPFEADLHYSGWPTLNFTAKLDRDGTHFAIHLIDVASDGTERITNRAFLDAQHRTGLEKSVPVAAGQWLDYHIRFFPQDDVIGQGHRLKIKIGAVDDWIQPDGTFAKTTIRLGGDAPAALTLPLVEDAKARFFTPLKVPT